MFVGGLHTEQNVTYHSEASFLASSSPDPDCLVRSGSDANLESQHMELEAHGSLTSKH